MNTGGSAFPMSGFDTRHGQPVQAIYQHGMQLRDYFAAKVLQSYMVNEVWRDDVYKLAAETSYKVADAMLKAREA